MAASRVDLPALGNPTSPTSARSFNSRINHPSCPSSPGWAYRGVWFVAVLKLLLPRPPRPPLQRILSCPGSIISNRTSSVSASLATVPTGTSRIMSSPFFPVRRPPDPLAPFSALTCLRYFRWIRVQNCGLALRMICPPRPPSPPSGPPLGTYFALWRCIDPAPPCPEAQKILT